MKIFCTGSPKLRFVLDMVETWVLPRTTLGKGNKLLILDAVPLSTLFIELVCNIAYVQTARLYSGLSEDERVKLAAKFNDPEDDLKLLIVMFGASSAGANFDGFCWVVIVLNIAHNAAVEAQSYNRVMRVSLLSPSHMQYFTDIK